MARRRPPERSERLDALRRQLAKAESDIRRFCFGECTHPVSKNPPPCDHSNEMMCQWVQRRAESLSRMIAEAEAEADGT